MCSTADGAHYSFAKAPRHCFVDWGPHGGLPLASAIDLHDLRWSHWGDARAFARAEYRVKTYDPWTHVRVVAYDRVHPEGPSYRAYGRIRVRCPDGSTRTWSLPTRW